MKNKIKRHNKIFTLFVLAMIISTNIGNINANYQIEEQRLNIVTTIAIPYDIVTTIAGDKADIISIVDSETDIHSFDGPTTQQITAMLDSDVIFSMGISGAEPWLEEIVNDNPELEAKIVNITSIHEGYTDPLLGSTNPHVWMNPHTAKKMANTVTETLIELDESDSLVFAENNNTYQQKLDILLDNIDANRTLYEGLKVVVNHPAFIYLFDLLGIERIAAIETHSGGEPGQATINEIIEKMEEENCSLIITTPQHSPSHAYEIARATGAKIAEISAIPGIYDNFEVKDYISMIEYILVALDNPVDPPAERLNYSLSIVIISILSLIGASAFITKKRH